MKYEEICKLVKYDEREQNLYMVNEIFDDLQNNIKKTPHIAFAYTFIYFSTWLFRYAKHFNVDEIIDNKKFKEVLGYNPNNQTLDYLIKKNGLLDKMEYTESVRDYPVSWSFSKYDDNPLEFTMYSEMDDYKDVLPDIPKRFFLKRPVKAFERSTIEDGEEYGIAGSFDDVSNTHNISFDVFLFCMSRPNISCIGFYLYCYLKHKNDLFSDGFDIPLTTLSENTGIAESTLDRYLGALKEYKLIDFRHNQDFFVVGMSEEGRMANTYVTRDYEFFSNSPMPYQRIKVIKNEEYLKMTKGVGLSDETMLEIGQIF